MQSTIKRAKDLARHYQTHDVPLYVSGPPGVGKSEMFKQLAAEQEIGFIDIRLATKLPEDLNGIPVPDIERQMAVWLRANFWPDVKRDGPRGIMLFDEMTDCSKMVQSASYQVVLDRRIGDLELSRGWWPVAAGNRREDRAAAQALSTALANRFAHIDIIADVDAWYEWALTQPHMGDVVPGFMKFKPDMLHSMEGADLRAFCTPRSWEQVARVIVDAPENLRQELVAGLVGDGAALDFENYLKVLDMPDIDEVVKNPKHCRIPSEPGSRFALSSHLSRFMKRENMAKVLTYIARPEFGREFETVVVLDATKRDDSLCETTAYVNWANRNKDLHL